MAYIFLGNSSQWHFCQLLIILNSFTSFIFIDNSCDLFKVLFMFQQYILSSSTSSTIFTIHHHLRRLLLLKYKLIKLPRNQSETRATLCPPLFRANHPHSKPINPFIYHYSIMDHIHTVHTNPQQIFQDPSPSCM